MRVTNEWMVLIAAALVGCSSQVDVGHDNPAAGGAAPSGGGGAHAEGGGGQGGHGGGGAEIDIRLRASTAPFPQTDGLSGQTPISHAGGIRSLRLFRNEGDPSPLEVFDFGADAVEVGYNDGDDTSIATVNARSLPADTFRLARVVHSHVRYRVSATGHLGSLTAPGEFDNMQVLSDGSRVDGELRDHGYFEYLFTTNGMDFPLVGDDAPTPEWAGSGGFDVRFEDGEWAYYFPVNIPIYPDLASDITIVLTVNMSESFRWQDEDAAGYLEGVFDATPSTFEPVMRFGPNSLAITIE
jgi:hypothetical protein